MIRPIADNLLIRPSPPDDELPSGLVLTDAASEPVVTGEVVAVGSGPRAYCAQARAVLNGLEDAVSHLQAADLCDVGIGAVKRSEVLNLIAQVRANLKPRLSVAPGDFVAFAPSAGDELTVDGESYLVMREDAVLAVLEDE